MQLINYADGDSYERIFSSEQLIYIKHFIIIIANNSSTRIDRILINVLKMGTTILGKIGNQSFDAMDSTEL